MIHWEHNPFNPNDEDDLTDLPKVCMCEPIMCGCTCGVFAEEMRAKGKVYDPWTRSWVDSLPPIL
jgi:hypothetical protein